MKKVLPILLVVAILIVTLVSCEYEITIHEKTTTKTTTTKTTTTTTTITTTTPPTITTTTTTNQENPNDPNEDVEESLSFMLNSDGQSYSVIGRGTCKGTDIVIPSSHNGLPVTSIGDDAFFGGVSITSIEIPDSVTNISEHAFAGCASLTSIEIPDSVTSIGDGAFTDCRSLTSIVIPDSVTSIGYNTFNSCISLINVVIPNSVSSIGEQAFAYCGALTSIEIPKSVTSIGEKAFYNCYLLIEVINKSSLNIVAGSSNYGYVGYYAKHVITDESQSAIKKLGDYIFYDDGTDIYLVKYIGSDLEITLPEYDGGKEYGIWSYAFAGCYSLNSVTIPSSVTSIGDMAFYLCISLTSVVIPDSVTSIGAMTFQMCMSLTICCEAESQPSGWSSYWNSSNCPVVWGYTGE